MLMSIAGKTCIQRRKDLYPTAGTSRFRINSAYLSEIEVYLSALYAQYSCFCRKRQGEE